MPSVAPCSGGMPEEPPQPQAMTPDTNQDHHGGCHPAEVSLDELLDLAGEPVGMVTDPACRRVHLRPATQWPEFWRSTFFGSRENTRRVLLYWFALIAALLALTIVATPAAQTGVIGLCGLWWLHRRRGRGGPPAEPVPA